jgi:5-methylcytosine-specific restriction endonuclease McrA
MVIAISTNGTRRQLEDWSHIQWRKAHKLVKNLRQRIFRARKLGNFKTLRSLQKLMQRSYANLLLSVRRITQSNKGKATAGIDKEIINTPAQRVILVNEWKGGNRLPTRRVEIPKPWEKRNQKLGKSYWAKGSRNYLIAQNQNWKCPICGEPLFNGEEIETHHIVLVAQGGLGDISNLQHLHAPCHKQVHSKSKSTSLR